MKTLNQLMQNTPRDTVRRSGFVTASLLGKVTMLRKKSLNALVFTARCVANTPVQYAEKPKLRSEYYDVIIELYPNQIHANEYIKPSLDTDCWVKCSCPYFLFHVEYALAKVGSSEIDYSNGRPPVVTNPHTIPHLCKHLYAAIPLVLKQSIKVTTTKAKYSFVEK